MRVSDWSSDVCSSDLPFKSQYSLLPAVSVRVLFFSVFFHSAGIVLFLWARKRPAGMASDFVLDRVFQARGMWILLVVLSSTGTVLNVLAKYYLTNLYASVCISDIRFEWTIGRASFRERVCPLVSLSVGAET